MSWSLQLLQTLAKVVFATAVQEWVCFGCFLSSPHEWCGLSLCLWAVVS